MAASLPPGCLLGARLFLEATHEGTARGLCLQASPPCPPAPLHPSAQIPFCRGTLTSSPTSVRTTVTVQSSRSVLCCCSWLPKPGLAPQRSEQLNPGSIAHPQPSSRAWPGSAHLPSAPNSAWAAGPHAARRHPETIRGTLWTNTHWGHGSHRPPAAETKPGTCPSWHPGAPALPPRAPVASAPLVVPRFGEGFRRLHYHFRHEVILVFKHPNPISIVTGFN